MHEVFPVVAGLVLGSSLTSATARMRCTVGPILTVLLGVAATVLSGEFLISWEFLLIDIPLVGVCALVSLAASRFALGRRGARENRDPVQNRRAIRALDDSPGPNELLS
jgi:hypothetical protein